MKRDAIISPDGTRRLRLSRTWDHTKSVCCFVMLNPSKADANIDDPTIRKCIGFATRLGFGGLLVVNLFSYRATKPRDLKEADYPGAEPGDDAQIYLAVKDTLRTNGKVYCAWGAHARGLARPIEVLNLLHQAGARPWALRLLSDGTPEHPLMLPYSCVPVPLSRFELR